MCPPLLFILMRDNNWRHTSSNMMTLWVTTYVLSIPSFLQSLSITDKHMNTWALVTCWSLFLLLCPKLCSTCQQQKKYSFSFFFSIMCGYYLKNRESCVFTCFHLINHPISQQTLSGFNGDEYSVLVSCYSEMIWSEAAALLIHTELLQDCQKSFISEVKSLIMFPLADFLCSVNFITTLFSFAV